MNKEFITLKFNINDISYIGKNPANFKNPNANWFNITVNYKEGQLSGRGYLKVYLDYLRIDKYQFVYSNKKDATVNIYDFDKKQTISVGINNIWI